MKPQYQSRGTTAAAVAAAVAATVAAAATAARGSAARYAATLAFAALCCSSNLQQWLLPIHAFGSGFFKCRDLGFKV